MTFDRDYGELIYRHRALPPVGVVYFRFAPATPSEPAEILLNVIDRAALSVIGKFTVVERGRVRQRSLHIERTELPGEIGNPVRPVQSGQKRR